jgi:predicted amidohydrolase YtcJ
VAEKHTPARKSLSRRQFIGGAAAIALSGGLNPGRIHAEPQQTVIADDGRDLAFINGRIHTMDPTNRVVSQILIRNGRFVAVGNAVVTPGSNVRVTDLMGKTVIPGIVDAHNHIVLVGNRPGWHTPLEHVFRISDAIAELKTRSAAVPRGEFITTIGPISAMQFEERRLPNLMELDAVDRPVYIQAAQGGTRTNSQGKAWLESKGVTVAADGTIAGPAAGLALQTLRKELLTAETRKRSAFDALQYYAKLGITSHKDSGAFHSDDHHTGIANENTYTMHNPFLALNREGRMSARVRLDFLHQDSPTANPPLPTLSQRLRNSFPFFGNDWLKTGGIGEFTGGGVEGLRAIAKAGWRGEDHALNLNGATTLIANREMVNAEISHYPTSVDHLAHSRLSGGIGQPGTCSRYRGPCGVGPHAYRH